MINYKVVHHVPGRIRLQVPAIKNLSIATLKKLSELPIPDGIKDVRANPMTGSLVITYNPDRIDIVGYLKQMMTNREILTIMGIG
jgi:Ca2+-transporting ATPase